MEITLYQLTKRENSTKLPVGEGVKINVRLKDDCNLVAPVFILSASYINFNYVKAFDRYYWVSPCTFISNDLIEMPCHIDVLASYKSEIGAETQYIMRSSNESAYVWGSGLTDNIYPAFNGYTEILSNQKNPFDIVDGFYSVGVAGSDIVGDAYCLCKRGAITYLAMNKAELSNLVEILNNLTMAQADINPLQFIVSCIYIPTEIVGSPAHHQYATTYGGASFVFNFTASPYIIKTGLIVFDTNSLDVPQHPSVSTRGQYLNYSPFIKHKLFAGPFGSIELPPEVLKAQADSTKITWTIYLDVANGKAIMHIGNWCRVEGQVGISTQLTQITTGSLANAYRNAAIVAGTIPKVATFNFLGAVSDIASVIQSGYENTLPVINTKGSNDAFTDLTPFYIETLYLTLAYENLEDIGRLVCRRLKISNIPGYIICSDADIDNIEATSEEIEMIRNYLNNGFFYE